MQRYVYNNTSLFKHLNEKALNYFKGSATDCHTEDCL